MNKKAFGMLVLVFFLFMFSMRVISNSFAKPQETSPKVDVEPLPLEDKRFVEFKKILSNSDYFKDSSFIFDSGKAKVTIDGKYDVLIKNGSYVMRIADVNLERDYCQIVDAVEVSLGGEKGESITTCMETLNGSIEIGGISAEIYDTYKILTVKSNEKALLYDITKSHVNGELISVDEINYNIKIDNYLLTSMSASYDSAGNLFKVCGHIYNRDDVQDEFIFATYNEKKERLTESRYKYANDTKKYVHFCVDASMDMDNAKYYSVERIGE